LDGDASRLLELPAERAVAEDQRRLVDRYRHDRAEPRTLLQAWLTFGHAACGRVGLARRRHNALVTRQRVGQLALVALRVAMLPRGIDGLFWPRSDDVEMVALVEKGSPEEVWARSFLPRSRCISYDLRTDLGLYPPTDKLLQASTIHEALRAHGISSLLLSAACTPLTRDWAERSSIRLWMVEYAEQRRLEDKIWFDGFLRRHRLPVPVGRAMRLGPRMRFPFRGDGVVQARDSMGGEGTFFVEDAGQAARLVRDGVLDGRRRHLVRQRVPGSPYGITVMVAPGLIALSALRRQCYYPSTEASRRQVFAGVQWIASAELSASLRRQLDRVFLRVGDLLYERRFFGFANVDFMIDDRERVRILECNPRMSAATPQLLHRDELLAGGLAGQTFDRGFLARRVFSSAVSREPLPDTRYRGSSLDIVSVLGGRVKRTWKSGVYRVSASGITYETPDVRRLSDDDQICLVSFARRGQTCPRDGTLAEVLANAPLYDARGGLSDQGRRVCSFFRYIE